MGTILLKNGRIVDGKGGDSFSGHVLIKEQKIVSVLNAQDELPNADTVIDAAGQVISPGFIDMHSHADWLLPLSDNHNILKYLLEQGVTTFVGGNCGFSTAPVTTESAGLLNRHVSRLLSDKPFDFTWNAMGEYLEEMEKNPPVMNAAELVGHVPVRFSVVGTRRGKMNDRELHKCLDMVRASFEEGACGFSFGLGYDPGMFSAPDELEAFCRVAAEADRPVTVHTKALSKISPVYPVTYLKPHNLRAINEMIEIAGKTGVRLQISHFIFVGRKSWHLVDQGLELVENARKSGIDVMIDAFPYTCGNTTVNVVFPYWFLDRLPDGYDRFFSRLRLRAELEAGFRLVGFIYKDFRVMDAVSDAWADLNGLNMVEIAKKWKTSPFKALLRLSRETDGDALMLFSTYSGEDGNEEPLEKVLSHESCLFETDVIMRSRGYPNPAGIGTFPRILGKYVREKRLFSLENAVRRMTWESAKRFAIKDRGLIAPDMAADVVIFDPKTVSDAYDSTSGLSEKPRGIRDVFVNGARVVEDGTFVEGRSASGTVIRV